MRGARTLAGFAEGRPGVPGGMYVNPARSTGRRVRGPFRWPAGPLAEYLQRSEDEVITILQKATGCSLEEAENETWEVHHLGRSVVHHGDRDECHRAATIIRTIGIKVAVEQV